MSYSSVKLQGRQSNPSPVDARLTVSRTSPLTPPTEIQQFFNTLLNPPEPPKVDKEKGEKEKPIPPPKAPIRVSISDREFSLESDDEMVVRESICPGQDNVILRSVRTKDMILGMDRLNSFTELEYRSEGGEGEKPGAMPVRFWREMANASRDVSPDAGSLRAASEKSLFL